MPAAAVIPAPLAYIKVAAVKKLVVGSRDRVGVFVASSAFRRRSCGRSSALSARSPPLVGFHLARAALLASTFAPDQRNRQKTLRGVALKMTDNDGIFENRN